MLRRILGAYVVDSSDPRSPDCPSDEDLALWCEHRLLPAEKLRLEQHLVECDACRRIVIEVCNALDNDVVVDVEPH